MKQKLKVIFRKYKDGDIIALLPEIAYRYNYTVLSYMHIGQHGEANYNHVINKTVLANESEYSDLYNELKHIYDDSELIPMKKAKINYFVNQFLIWGLIFL